MTKTYDTPWFNKTGRSRLWFRCIAHNIRRIFVTGEDDQQKSSWVTCSDCHLWRFYPRKLRSMMIVLFFFLVCLVCDVICDVRSDVVVLFQTKKCIAWQKLQSKTKKGESEKANLVTSSFCSDFNSTAKVVLRNSQQIVMKKMKNKMKTMIFSSFVALLLLYSCLTLFLALLLVYSLILFSKFMNWWI